MARRPFGKAAVNPTSPRAAGVCDRCGAVYQLHKLLYQHQWAGTELINLRLRVCETCMDVPSLFLRTMIIPPDPPPVIDPRVEPYAFDEIDYRVTEEGDQRVTETGDDRVLDSTGSEEYGEE